MIALFAYIQYIHTTKERKREAHGRLYHGNLKSAKKTESDDH